MILFQIIFILIIIFSLSRAILRFREGVLKPIEIIFWFFIWIIGATIVIFPDVSSVIAHVFGINRGADLITYSSVILLFYLSYRLYVKVENTSKKIDQLIRRLSSEKPVNKTK